MREVTDEELLNIYQIVGRFMLMYARIEMSLTHGAIVIFEHAGGRLHQRLETPPRIGGE
jgi:hypothetical protein